MSYSDRNDIREGELGCAKYNVTARVPVKAKTVKASVGGSLPAPRRHLSLPAQNLRSRHTSEQETVVKQPTESRSRDKPMLTTSQSRSYVIEPLKR